MYRIKQFLSSLDHHELLRMKQEMDKGSLDLAKQISERIKELEKKHDTMCATCSGHVNLNSINSYTLMFGPEDFRKKASFCGIDCLEYFTGQIKTLREEEQESE